MKLGVDVIGASLKLSDTENTFGENVVTSARRELCRTFTDHQEV